MRQSGVNLAPTQLTWSWTTSWLCISDLVKPRILNQTRNVFSTARSRWWGHNEDGPSNLDGRPMLLNFSNKVDLWSLVDIFRRKTSFRLSAFQAMLSFRRNRFQGCQESIFCRNKNNSTNKLLTSIWMKNNISSPEYIDYGIRSVLSLKPL